MNSMGNAAGNLNWLHGHWGARAGSNHYNGDFHQNIHFSIPVMTNWVAMCGSNSPNTNGLGVMVNGIINLNERGGHGNCALGVNHGEQSDWQLSKVYVWNTWLSDEDLTLASLSLHSALFTDTTAAGVCLPCQVNSESQAGASVCECSAGYTGQNGWVCRICPPNTFKAEVGPGSCTPCPANADSPSGNINSTNCRCRTPFFGVNGGFCTPCLANSQSVGPSLEITICRCNANYFGAYGQACTLCPPNSASPAGSTVITDCKCNPGYFEVDGVCSIPVCPAGKYSSAPDHTVCNAAAVIPSYFAFQCSRDSDCNYPNCRTVGSNSGCWSPGFWGGGWLGSKCWQGGNAWSAGVCHSPVRCIDGCYDCPIHSGSIMGSNRMIDCKCNPGATGGDGRGCSLCVAGKYKTMTGSAQCIDCTLNSNSPVGTTAADACLCNA